MVEPSGPLRRRLPSLHGVAHVTLGTYPTPVVELDLRDVVPAFRGSAWVKREDLSGAETGGNKVRKLEYLLGRAREVGARGVITVGGIGSNHCLATAFYGPEAGLDVRLVIFPHDVTPSSRRTLRAVCALGPRIAYAPTGEAAATVVAARYAASFVAGERLYAILPGGSSARGTVGSVEAGLELAEQLSRGELRRPDAVFVAYSSGGTAAGLALGLHLGGVATDVVGVRVYPAPLASASMLRNLAERTWRFLRARCDEELPPFEPRLLRAPGEYLGGGYATPTEAGSAAREAAAGLGLEMEPTYTGKAFAAFLDAAGSRRFRDKDLLFVQTYDGRLAHRLGEEPVRTELVPPRLRPYV